MPSFNPESTRAAGAPTFIRLAAGGFVGDSIVDGPGLRCTIFTQGCPHACPGCHNPATHPFAGGEVLDTDTLLRRIHSFPLCRAVTFSGGEPFCQSEALLPLAQMLHKEGYELAAYSGYTFEQLMQTNNEQRGLLSLLHTLIDGPFLLAERDLSLRFRGSRNQRILNIPKSIAAGAPIVETAARWGGEE